MLRIGKGVRRGAVRKAFSRRARPSTFGYTGILRASDIEEAVAGIRDAGTPKWSLPLLAWLASHPSSPEEVLRELGALGSREVLLSLAMNRNLPHDMRRTLLNHEDEEIRDQANHVFSRTKKH